MARTLATEKQAEAIKKRMAEIRSELPYSADQARQSLSQLTDWRYHMAKRPWPIIAAAVVAGYVLVPRKGSVERVIVRSDPNSEDRELSQPATKKLAAGIAGTIGTLMLRQATSVAASQVANLLTERGAK